MHVCHFHGDRVLLISHYHKVLWRDIKWENPIAWDLRDSLNFLLMHLCVIQIPFAIVIKHLHFFIPLTGKLWNTLPLSIFPHAYDLNAYVGSIETKLTSSLATPSVYFQRGSTFFFLCLLPWNCLLLKIPALR